MSAAMCLTMSQPRWPCSWLSPHGEEEADMRAARQVDVVLQNHTQELLTIEGGINIQGDWNPALGPPKIGSVVAKQGSVKWSTMTIEANGPCEANVRLGCT